MENGWTYPHPGTDDTPADGADDSDDTDDAQDTDDDQDEQDNEDGTDDTGDDTAPDAPPEVGEQDDARWEEELPLNGVNVGDLVMPAIPAASASAANPTGAAATPATSGDPAAPNPFENGRDYGWMKPEDS